MANKHYAETKIQKGLASPRYAKPLEEGQEGLLDNISQRTKNLLPHDTR